MPQAASPASQASNDTPKSGGRRRLLLILLVILVATAGLVYFLSGGASVVEGSSSGGIVGGIRNIFGSGAGSDGQAPQGPVNDKDVKVTQIDSFVVNLADQGRYLRTTITLEYTDTAVERELAAREYRVRDAIISVLRTKQVADLQPSATGALREELITAINQALSGKIIGLYFDEFIIQ